MKIKKSLNTALIFLLISCTNMNKEKPENWSEDQLNQWFKKSEWKQGWSASPDESINKKEFAIQYYKNKDRWDKAFAFLKTTRLDTLSIGSHDIIGKDVYAAVSEYATKNEEDAKFEAHRIYADIQYVVRGTEKMGIIPLEKTQPATQYDETKDILFLSAEGGIFRTATPDQFFVFFPGDAHRPGIKIDTNAPVKKVVVKVRIN
jgi:YhcH/YjgK/YiaL family protein